MTMEEIQSRVKAIDAEAGDNETQHSMQDKLYLDFIKYVATLEIPIAEKAREVAKVDDMPFSRWYA